MATFTDIDVKELTYSATVAAHGETQRAIYTCPASPRRAILKLVAAMLRDTVGGVAANNAYIRMAINGNTFFSQWNALNVNMNEQRSTEIVITPGNSLQLYTLNAAASNFTFTLYAQIWEYQ